MDRYTRLRRVGLLCCHFSRNYAYYKAGYDNNGQSRVKDQFWATIQGNFLDISIMEWAKLFGNYSDAHHWKNIVTDPNSFKTNILMLCNITEAEFTIYHKEIKLYRNNFVAHLESELTMNIPNLTNALIMTKLYYEVVYKELSKEVRHNLPENLNNYYNACFMEARDYF